MRKLKLLLALVFLVSSLHVSYGQGCTEPGEGDGINWFGYIQPQYDYNFLGADPFNKNTDESGFHFERARLGVLGNIPYDFTYYFMMEFSQTRGIGINDAFVTYNRFGPWFKISAGLFKSPFSMEQSQGCHKLYTINRSHVVNELAGPIRDMGVMILGGSGDKSFLGMKTKNAITYRLAVLNGEGRNKIDSDNRKKYVARLVIHPVDFISVGTSYSYGNLPPKNNTAEQDDYVTRMGFDVKLEYKNFIATGEYIKGKDVGSYLTGGGCSGEPLEVHEGSKERMGYYAMLLYNTPWELQPVIRYESYEPDFDTESDIISNITLGVNYFFNEWTRLQVNYLYNVEETGQVEHPNDVLSVQLQAIIK